MRSATQCYGVKKTSWLRPVPPKNMFLETKATMGINFGEACPKCRIGAVSEPQSQALPVSFPRRVGLTHHEGWSATNSRPASLASSRDPNRAKSVAPDPLIRASVTPAERRRHSRAWPMGGWSAIAAASRSFLCSDSQTVTSGVVHPAGGGGRSAVRGPCAS